MGKMKELYMSIMQEYDGKIPNNLSIAEAQQMLEQIKNQKSNECKSRDKTGLQHGK